MTYEWTVESNTQISTLPPTDWDDFFEINVDDGSLSVDVMAFLPVADIEEFAFVLNGNFLKLSFKCLFTTPDYRHIR